MNEMNGPPEPSVSQQEQTLQEAGSNSDLLPFYDLQLRDVILWELNCERIRVSPESDKTTAPQAIDISWDVETLPGGQRRSGPAARLSLDYLSPLGKNIGYAIHVELIGIFTSSSVSEGHAERVERAGPGISRKASSKQPQRPLNDYTVISLLWPYMRELLHQLQSRMRVPLRLLPTLDVANMQTQVEDQASEAQQD
jgi:preprotein translocase subunit SecB